MDLGSRAEQINSEVNWMSLSEGSQLLSLPEGKIHYGHD